MNAPVVIDASAAVELLARTDRGSALRALLPERSIPWVPDGVFDVEVGSVLRRWDLRGVLTDEQMASALLRFASWQVRRASVRMLHHDAWTLRHNITYSDPDIAAGCCAGVLGRLIDRPGWWCGGSRVWGRVRSERVGERVVRSGRGG